MKMGLSEHIHELIELAERQGLAAGQLDLRILDLRGMYPEPDGKWRVSSDRLYSTNDFSPVFDSFVASNLSWISLSIEGLIDGCLVVSVQCSKEPGLVGSVTRVSRSGMTTTSIATGFLATDVVLTDPPGS